ncbi:MAG: argininosuccinate lyase [Spirochaetes bacterium]|nr:argininosuccinate lyase [Spirochaetota bacterium]
MKQNKKLWGGRFTEPTSGITEKISASIHYDARLYGQDIRGSIAHAKMLKKAGILSATELESIISGLGQIQKEIEAGSFRFDASLEDIHMNIEACLTERIGEAGKKLHTARSRNDQIALDLRLYLKDESKEIQIKLKELTLLLVNIAEDNLDIVMPGYTHMQIAQPVRFSQHILVYAQQLLRDLTRLENASLACGSMPLGAGALAGVNYLTDREFLSNELGFSDITHNSMDTVSDRDFILDFLYFASVLGMHFSRLCEELILWSTSEFEFIRLSDKVTTGSSIMPQKRNPDVAELVRGKTGRLYGNLLSLLTMLKGIPLTYNRDLQEDKEPLFDSVDTVRMAIEGIHEMLSSMKINKEKMLSSVFRNFSTAVDLADYLVKKGVPFRESHEIIGSIVQYCEKNNADFFKLSIDILKDFSKHFSDDAIEKLDPTSSPERKESSGSTSKSEIIKQIEHIKSSLDKCHSKN